MRFTSRHRARRDKTWSAMGNLPVEVLLQVILCGSVALFGAALYQAGMISVAPALIVLASSIAVAAAILLALAGWLGTDGAAVRLAFAVLVYGMVFLLEKAVEQDPTANELLVRDLTMLGVVALFGRALRRAEDVERAWRSSALVSIAVAAVAVAGAVLAQTTDVVPPAVVRSGLDIGAWVVTAIVGLALLSRGIHMGAPLLRSTGLALVTVGVAPSPIAELAGAAMLAVTAVTLVVHALRTVLRAQAESESRLHAAERTVARTAIRDHEMRNLVAGLSGAVSVLTAQPPTAEDFPECGQLRAATRAELDRLRRMLEGRMPEGDQQVTDTPSPVAVGPLLSGLAALHSTRGAAIEVTIADDSHVLIPPDCLAHIVTNLLVNCARHAQGARVWLTTYRHGDRVLIEVTDDGPGLAPGLSAELLRPGVRGPSSTGSGLGLHVSAQLVARYRGAIRLVPTPVGCTVVVELPAATADALPRKAVTV